MSPSRRAIQLTSRPPVLQTSDSQKSTQGSYRQIPRHFSSLLPQPIRLYGSISSRTLHIFLNLKGCTFCPSQLYDKAPPEYRYSPSGQFLSVRPWNLAAIPCTNNFPVRPQHVLFQLRLSGGYASLLRLHRKNTGIRGPG